MPFLQKIFRPRGKSGFGLLVSKLALITSKTEQYLFLFIVTSVPNESQIHNSDCAVYKFYSFTTVYSHCKVRVCWAVLTFRAGSPS